MQNLGRRIIIGACHTLSALCKSAASPLAGCALLLSFGLFIATAHGQQQESTPDHQQPAASPAKEMPPMPAAPARGKAIICIYRQGRAVGSAAHDHLYVNGIYLATLLNGEYAWTEVAPGTVVVAGAARMYYGPSVIMSSAAAVNQARDQTERIRVEAEAGKVYYMKWTSGMFASGITVKLMDADVGAKEMHKLHPSKPENTGEDKSDSKGQANEAAAHPDSEKAAPETGHAAPGK